MNYLQDKKTKRKKLFTITFFSAVLIVLLYFSSGIFNSFSYVTHILFRPFFILGNNIGGKFGNIGALFASKNSLFEENADLKSELDEKRILMSNYDSILSENVGLKEILGRKTEKESFVLSAILSKPNQSPYDTLIIDIGINDGIKEGDVVFAFGNVPIGRISAAYPNSSKVILFSNAGEKTQVVVSEVFMEAVGRGGGNFEMIIPSDFTPSKGYEVVLPGITPHVLGVVETIISDPRDPFIKALLVSPVNIQELKFVEVKREK